MSPGEARVGQKVRTLVAFSSYPKVTKGTYATIREVIAQNPGAETDALIIHPHGWREDLCMPCNASDVELVFAE